MINLIERLHHSVFSLLEKVTQGWFLELFARMVFASVLLVYFINSAMTKISPGFFGFLTPSDGAYAQILPSLMEQVGYDTSQISFFPYGLIVVIGTWSEFILPILVVIGLFTRVAAIGMIGFIIVMSIVDITGHGLDAQTIGTLFDGNPGSLIAGQRLLWVTVLLIPVLRGGGLISLDALLQRTKWRSERYY